ncbi:36723_t:CDS:2, partial [Gigaspora margarita]
YNINERKDIVEVIKDIKGTSVANIQPIVISKLKDETKQSWPNPKVSDYTIMNSSWKISLLSN